MPRKSSIWLRASDNNYYTTLRGKKYNLGPNLDTARMRFQHLTILNGARQPKTDNLRVMVKTLKIFADEVGGWENLIELVEMLESFDDYDKLVEALGKGDSSDSGAT